MFVYILALQLLVLPAFTAIINIPSIPNCQRNQISNGFISCANCAPNFKLIDGNCIPCQQGDQHYSCLYNREFEFGGVSRNNEKPQKIKFEIKSPINNIDFIEGSSAIKGDAQSSLEAQNSDNLTLPLSNNSLNLQFENVTDFQDDALQLNITENNIEIDDEFEGLNQTLNYTSTEEGGVEGDVKYVEYKKQFKISQLQVEKQSLDFNKVDFQRPNTPQSLKLIDISEIKLFITENKFMDTNHPHLEIANKDLCVTYSEQQGVCLECIEGYIPIKLSVKGNMCKKMNQQIKIGIESKLNYDPNCAQLNVLGGQSEQDIINCAECKTNYLYSKLENKCILKDPFCEIIDEPSNNCAKCIEGFAISSDTQICIKQQPV